MKGCKKDTRLVRGREQEPDAAAQWPGVPRLEKLFVDIKQEIGQSDVHEHVVCDRAEGFAFLDHVLLPRWQTCLLLFFGFAGLRERVVVRLGRSAAAQFC